MSREDLDGGVGRWAIAQVAADRLWHMSEALADVTFDVGSSRAIGATPRI